MATIPNLSEEHRKTMIGILAERRKIIVAEIDSKQAELQSIDAIADKLNAVEEELPIIKKTSKIPTRYPSDQAWFLRIAFVINEAGRFIPLGQIMDSLRRYEPEIGEPQRKTVSGTISGKVKEYDTIAMYKPKGSHGLYGLIDWTDELNNPKPEYI